MSRSEDSELMDLINLLRTSEGESVTIFCDNPDFTGPNNMISCCGAWTHWREMRFEGRNLKECLEKAVATMQHTDLKTEKEVRELEVKRTADEIHTYLAKDLALDDWDTVSAAINRLVLYAKTPIGG